MNRKLSPFWTLFILTGLNLFNYLDRFILSAVLPFVQTEFRIADEQAGNIGTIFMTGYFATSPVFGFFGDRSSRKGLIAAGIFVWSLATVLTGFATSLAMLFVCRAFVGVGEASYASISPGYISDTFPPAKRNNALSIFYVAIPVGAALGTILGGIVAAHFGWRNAFIWAGAPGLLLALTLLPFAEPKRGQADGISESSASSHLPVPRDVLKLLLIPDYLLVVLGYVAYTFAMGGFGYWGPTFLHRIHNIPQEKAATFFGAVLVVAGLVGTLIGGFAATAWHKRNRAGYAWLLGISVLLSIPVTAIAFLSGSEKISMTCLAIAMFLLFLSTGPVNTIIIEAVPMNLRTSAMALSIFMIHLFGDLWSPKIIGRFSDTWGSLQKAVMILPIALLVCAILWLCLAVKTMRSENQRQVLN